MTSMHRVLALSAAMLIASAAHAASPTELDRAAAALTGTTAQFTHRFTPKGFRNSQVESGTVTFGALPMMRWEYTRPEAKLFVFDGTRSWFYLPADKQVTVTQLDEQRRRELPFLFLGNPAEREKYFVVTEKSNGASTAVTLQPRDRGAMIRSVTITITPATHQIQRVDYSDRDGNQTVFELTGFRKSNPGPATFRFTPPAGVQVVEQ
jgi:outer membrane lipoprotein carrier protein